MEKFCDTCRFYRHSGPRTGDFRKIADECRYNAPYADGFPLVSPKRDWCRNHRITPEAQTDELKLMVETLLQENITDVATLLIKVIKARESREPT